MKSPEFQAIERDDKEWYIIVEDENSPKRAWSWLDYASAYGPFDSLSSSIDYMIDILDISGVTFCENNIIRKHHYSCLSHNQKRPYESLINNAQK